MKETPGVDWKKLWGVNAENNLTEIMIAKILPRSLNKPPQMRGEYLGLWAVVFGLMMRVVILLHTLFAPFLIASVKSIVSASSRLKKMRLLDSRTRPEFI